MHRRTAGIWLVTFSNRLLPDLPLFCSVVIMVTLFSAHAAAQPARGANKFLGNITQRGNIPLNFLTYWNHITGENECKWASIERTRDKMNWSGADSIAAFAREHDLPWRFHSLLTSGACPPWIHTIPDSVRREEIGEWMDSAAARFPDVTMIDVINEGYPSHTFPGELRSALGGNGATGFDWVIDAFRMARERWPNAKLIYNDYFNLEYENEITWTLDLIDAMKAANAPIDIIGCEATDAWKLPTETIKKNIDRLAATGLPVYISNYGIETPVDAVQDSIMREQFTMFWNHPKVIGITYWGYVNGQTWRDNMGLVSDSGMERPALTELVDFVNNNPDPPNDFPELLDLGTDVTAHQYGTLPTVAGNPVTNLKGMAPGVFNLQGRIVSTRRNGDREFVSENRPTGMYLMRHTNRCRLIISR